MDSSRLPSMCKHRADILHSQNLGKAVDILYAAFRNAPLISYMFPVSTKHEKHLRWYFRASIRYALLCGQCHINPAFNGIALWQTPVSPVQDLWGMMRSGIVTAPIMLGRENYKRMIRIGGLIREFRQEIAPPGHWYLSELAVLPSQQGQGIGTGLVKQMLPVLDNAGIPCYAETFNFDAISFYNRLGFQLAGSYITPFNSLVCHCLVRFPDDPDT